MTPLRQQEESVKGEEESCTGHHVENRLDWNVQIFVESLFEGNKKSEAKMVVVMVTSLFPLR